MINFKNFYNNLEEISKEINTDTLNESSLTPGLFSNSIVANVGQILLPTVGVLSVFSDSKKVEEFSKEVANYATSDDVISSLSEKIGTPRINETEQEFVERASNVLREILKNKFKIS
jgi:hypothetical protein